YLARNWATKFGRHVEPQFGAIISFWRGKIDGTDGHVGFLVGESDENYYVLGGNQSNSVSIAPIAKNRKLDTRWPLTVPVPDKVFLPEFVGGKLSTNEA